MYVDSIIAPVPIHYTFLHCHSKLLDNLGMSDQYNFPHFTLISFPALSHPRYLFATGPYIHIHINIYIYIYITCRVIVIITG